MQEKLTAETPHQEHLLGMAGNGSQTKCRSVNCTHSRDMHTHQTVQNTRAATGCQLQSKSTRENPLATWPTYPSLHTHTHYGHSIRWSILKTTQSPNQAVHSRELWTHHDINHTTRGKTFRIGKIPKTPAHHPPHITSASGSTSAALLSTHYRTQLLKAAS